MVFMDFTKILQILQVNKIWFFFAFTINWHINGRNVLLTQPTWPRRLQGPACPIICSPVVDAPWSSWCGGWLVGWVGCGWLVVSTLLPLVRKISPSQVPTCPSHLMRAMVIWMARLSRAWAPSCPDQQKCEGNRDARNLITTIQIF